MGVQTELESFAHGNSGPSSGIDSRFRRPIKGNRPWTSR
ncbi:hypothetical protein SBD_2336 [Streptomyces bottropensis ATCC 25435]|uniref:Uncharacterized protein n=1 Tax=Streptomyces bottropensis ATCC 25435 TaxID=1054862 RepID=M3FVR4_9ACTN|nr:hypothetical protein SBD_2336 [Streptomyces bottropensis ATCC 25435]